MKKLIALTLAMVLALSLLAACGGGGGSSGVGNNDDLRRDGEDGKIDIEKAAENILEDAISNNAFSVAAADASLKARGVSKSAVEPDWPYTVDEEKMQAYGDTSHGVIRFTKKDGYVSDEEYEAWLKKAFSATAAASDDGYNIQGFSWGDGDIEKTWEEFISGESFIVTWSYRYNGTIMDVYVEQAKEKDSDYDMNEDGEWFWTHYYNGVQIDIADGLQKGWDDMWQDLEDAFEEYGDEIQAALEDAAK